MGDFDLDRYLANRFGSGSTSKVDQLNQARERKILELSGFNAAVAATAPKVAADKAAQEASLFGEYSQGGVLDTALATLVAPVTQAGNAIAGALDMYNAANETDSVKAAQTRAASQRIRDALNMDSLVGINPDTGERTSSLYRRVMGDGAVAAVQGSAAAVQGVVGLGSLASGGRAGQAAEEAGFRPKEGIAILDELLSPEMRLANKKVSEADGFGGTVDEILASPSTIPHNIIKSVPSMILGGGAGKAIALGGKVATGVAGAMGEGLMMAGSQAEEIRGETADGRLTLKQSLLAAGTGLMGAGVGVVGNKLAKALRVGDIDEALVIGASAKSPRGILTRALLAGGVEGGEELLQSSGEQVAKNVALDRPYDEGVGNAAALGMLTGAPMGALGAGSGTTKEQAAQETEAFKTAVAANDPSIYLDKTGFKYNPAKAIGVLYGNSQQADATPETKQANLASGEKIVADLQEEHFRNTDILDAAKGNPADLAVVQTKLDNSKAVLATLDPADPAAADQIAKLTTLVDYQTAVLEASKDKKSLQKQTDLANESGKQLAEVRKVQTQLTKKFTVAATPVEIESVTVAANAPVDIKDPVAVKTAQESVSKLLNLSMVSTSTLTPEKATELADNKANALTLPQRAYLREFSQARIAENALMSIDMVSKEVFTGNDKTGDLGIQNYRSILGKSMEAGDQKTTDRYMRMLSSFASDHQAKNVAVVAAFANVKVQGDTQIARSVDGAWGKPAAPMSSKDLKANGGLLVHPNSNKEGLITGITAESVALNQAYKEQQAAYALKFNKKAPAPVVAAATPAPVRSASVAAVKVVSPASTPVAAQVTAAPTPAATPVVSAKVDGVVVDPSPLVETTQETKPTVVADAATTEAKPKEGADVETTTTTSTVDEKAETTPEVVATVQETGEPSVLKQYDAAIKGKLGEVFKTVNLVAQFFTVESMKEGNLTQRPLLAIKDFLTAWSNKEVDPIDYLSIDKVDGLTEEQTSALDNLKENLVAWSPLLAKSFQLYDGNPDFKYDDMMQYLYTDVDGKAVTDENVTTAIAASVYSWITSQANAPALKTAEQVNKMHGKDKDGYIDPAQIGMLQELTAFEHTVVSELGKAAVKALGLKMRPGSPQNLMANLETAMGTHALAFLVGQGFATVPTLNVELVESFFTKDASPDQDVDDNAVFVPTSKVDYKYVAFTYGEDNTNTDQVSKIQAANYGSMSVVDKLFDIERAPTFASTERADVTQKKAKNSNQDVPNIQHDAVQMSQNESHTAIPEMLDIAFKMGPDSLLKVAGSKDSSAESQKHHKVNRPAIDAQNRNLGNQWDLMMEMFGKAQVKDGFEQAFYVNQSVWKNFRAGFSNQSLNLQTSKIHRFLFAKPSWTVEIDFDKTELVNEFLISVAMAMGVKTDQSVNTDTLAKHYANLETAPVLKKEGFMEAVAIIRESNANDLKPVAEQVEVWTPANIELVQEVAIAGEGMMSLQAMVAFSKFLDAKELKSESFKFTMLVGADGKTNGPMLTLLALGATDFDMLNRGGMYSTDKEQAPHFSVYAAGKDSMDLYQFVGRNMLDQVDTHVATEEQIKQELAKAKTPRAYAEAKALFTQAQLDSFTVLSGELRTGAKVSSAMRNMVKTPLTAFFFGSSLSKAILGMEESFIEGWYESLEKMRNGTQTKGQTLVEFLTATNVLLKQGTSKGVAPQFDVNTTIETLMERALTKRESKALRSSFQTVMGKPAGAAMRSTFSLFIKRRDAINKTIQASHTVYASAYADARAAKMKELMDSGEIATREVSKGKNKGDLVALHDMTVEQEDAVRRSVASLAPVMHSAMSLNEANLKAGLYMGKQVNGTSLDGVYQSNVNLKYGIDGRGDSSRRSNRAAVRTETDAGVAGLSYAIHSSDSAIMNKGLLEVPESLNVHDEISNSVLAVANAARAVNKGTVDTFLHYSPTREAANMFQRLVVGLASKVAKNQITKETVNKIFIAWAEAHNSKLPADDEVSVDQIAEILMKEALDAAMVADRDRLTLMSKMSVMDQYTWEGGQFEVTQDIRDQALAMIDKLPVGIPPAFLDAVGYLNKVLVRNSDGAVAVPESLVIQDDEAGIEEDQTTEPQATETFWGKLGTPVIDSDEFLVDLLSSNGTMPARDLVVALRKRLEGSTAGKLKAIDQILFKVGSLLTADVTVQYVTKNTPLPDNLEEKPETGARGWFIARKDGKDVIYILGTDYQDSGLTGELALHELLHSVLGRVIQHQLNLKGANAKHNSAAYRLVRELEAMRVAAKKFLGEDATYNAALENVHEFVSWGLSNAAFQRNVLMKVEMKGTTKKNILVKAMSSFITSLTSFFFGDKATAAQNTVMSQLLTNVSGLFEEASKNRTPLDVGVNQSQVGSVDSYTSQDIYRALDNGSVTPAFGAHQLSLIASISEKIFGAANAFKEAFAGNQTQEQADAQAKALASGDASFSSNLMASGFTFDNQSAFVAEQVGAAIVTALDGNNSIAYGIKTELIKLEKETRERLSAKDFHKGDWATAQPHEQANAQALYDYLFNNVTKDSGEKSQHLARFAALGLAHEGFNSLLKVSTKRAPSILADRTISGALFRVFHKILEALNGGITRTRPGQQADLKLAALVRQLVRIESRKRAMLNQELPSWMQFANKTMRDTREGAKSQLGSLLESNMFRKSKNTYVRAASNVVGILADSQVRVVVDGIAKLRNEHFTGIQGITAGILGEMNGPRPSVQGMFRLIKRFEGLRKKVIDLTNKGVLESFVNAGQDLSDDSKYALTTVLLRTDTQVLLDHFDTAQLETLLKDPAALKQEIAKFEAKLGKLKPVHTNFMLKQSKALAYQMVTGEAKIAFLLRNAGNIANMFGSSYEGQLTATETKDATDAVDALVSLYALTHVGTVDRLAVIKMMEDEHARQDGGNGVKMVLLTHKKATQDSKERLFNGSEALFTKGYVPEVYNPHTDVKTANDIYGKALEGRGYEKGARIGTDPHDDNKEPMHLYVLRDGGLMPWLSGMFSFTNTRSKGSKHYSDDGARAQKAMHADKLASVASMHDADPNWDPAKVRQNYSVPVMNAHGEATNYAYLMHTSTKDSVLQRDSRFDTVMGVLAGSIFDKENSKINNRKVVQLLHDEFDTHYAKDTKAFLSVSPTSAEPELRDLYRMLPKATKDAIREIWGTDEIQVSAANMDIAFGYRKLTISSAFDKAPDQRNPVEQAFVFLVTRALEATARVFKGMNPDDAKDYSQRGAVVVRRTEAAWLSVMQEIKDIIVVKTGTVMAGNIGSNLMLLKLHGVSNMHILRDSKIAWDSAEDYDRDSRALFKLRNEVEIGFGSTDLAETKREIIRLESAIDSNPVKNLIDAGLMPTIVEDLGDQEDIYSYKSLFVRKTKKYTDKVNPGVRSFAKGVYMAHDSQIYKGLSRVTQLSDFVARYALYQHLTTRQENPLTHEKAIQEASDGFINYDIPLHRKLAYMDDMGVIMFTKYFLRVQRVIRKRFQDAPGRVAMLIAAQGYFDWIPSILDSSMFTRIGNNPFGFGALQFPTVLDELATINTGISLMKD